jgi:hypothetical protein
VGRATLLVALLLLVGACQAVAPWERGTLARRQMQLEPDRLARSLDDQVHGSKEAASGGNRSAGAGCGCN